MNLFVHCFLLRLIDRSIETPAEKLISTQYENQRLQKELDSMERKFEKLDSRIILFH
jgi:hypothetical protein